MITVKVIIPKETTDYFNSLLKRIMTGANISLNDSRQSVVDSIRTYVPVWTGNLQRSISSNPTTRFASLDTGNLVVESIFYSNLYYARIIDEGLNGYKRRNYLQRGVNKELPYIVNRIEDNIIVEIER